MAPSLLHCIQGIIGVEQRWITRISVIVWLLSLPCSNIAQNVTANVELEWSTYHGGDAEDVVLSVALDEFGHVYVAGRTTAGLRLGNDTTGRSGLTHQRDFGGGASDAFLAKIAPQGSVLWCTYFGGVGDDEAVAVVVVGMDGVYLVGHTTSTDSIATDTLAHQTTHGGGSDLFIARFTEFGLLLGATYFGSADEERATSASLDVHGDLLVAGTTNGAGSLDGTAPVVQPYSAGTDGLLLRFDGTAALVAGTFIGGEGEDAVVRIAAGDSSGTVLMGNTTSATNIALGNGITSALQGGTDGFIMNVDTNLAILQGHYFGGSGNDELRGLAKRQGRIAICGVTDSDSLHSDTTGYQAINAGGGDGFIAVLDSAFALSWYRFVGDTAFDALSAVAFDKAGNLYAAGVTAAQGMADIDGDGDELNGTSDVFAMRFDTAFALTWARYVGGASEDEARALWVQGNTSVFIGGRTTSEQQMALLGHQTQYGGGPWDGMTARLDQDICTEPAGICTGTTTGYGGGGGNGGSCNGVSPPLLQFEVCLGQSIQFMAFGGALGNGAEWMWYADACGIPSQFLTSGDTITLTPTESFTLYVRAESLHHTTGCRSLPIVVHLPPTPVISVSDTVCAGAPILLEGTGAEAFAWQFADTLLTGLQVQLNAPLEAATLAVQVTASSGPVCTVLLEDTVVVLPTPHTPWTVTHITCAGGADGTIMLDSTATTDLTISWEPQSIESQSLVDLTAGVYIATSTDVFGCSATDTLIVDMPPPLMDSVSMSHALCGGPYGGATVMTTSQASGLLFDWGNGYTETSTVDALLPGTYTVSAIDSAGCSEERGFFIEAIGLVSVHIGMDTVWAPDGQTLLQSLISPMDTLATFAWTPAWGLDDPTAASTLCKVTDTTTYVITVTSAAGCIISDTVVVVPVPIEQIVVPTPCGEAFLPTIFSPNGDGLNDALCLLGGCYVEAELTVYDSWGQRVFIGGVNSLCWDGTLNGTPLPPGIYAYTLTAARSVGEAIEQSGTITLRR